MKNVTILAVIFAVIGIITPAVPATEVVSLRLYGNVFPAPATIPVTITVEPAAKNRMLLVEADGDRYFRSSAMTLDGADEKRLHTMEFKSLPAGNYVIRAQVRSATDVLGTASEGLQVIGEGGER